MGDACLVVHGCMGGVHGLCTGGSGAWVMHRQCMGCVHACLVVHGCMGGACGLEMYHCQLVAVV